MSTKLLALGGALSALVLIGHPLAATEKCDCNHFPWSPEACVKICGASVLNRSNEAELAKFLHLDTATIQEITSVKAGVPKGEVKSLDVFKAKLSPEQYEKLMDSIFDLKPLEIRYLLESPEEKQDFRSMVMEAPPKPSTEVPPVEIQSPPPF